MKFIVFIFIVLISSCQTSPAYAETSLLLGGWSHHFIEKAENENHRLVAIDSAPIIIGYFRNSFNNDSVFAAYSHHVKFYSKVSGFAYLGAVRGYEECFGDSSEHDNKKLACPFAAIGVKYSTDYNIDPQVMLLGTVAVLTLSIPLGEF